MIQRTLFAKAKESSAFIWKMANDSPAKSLVDIDLASLRVSAAEPSRCFFKCFKFIYIYISSSVCFDFYSTLRRSVWLVVAASLSLLSLLEMKYWKWPLSHSEVLPVSAFPLFEMRLACRGDQDATAGSQCTMLLGRFFFFFKWHYFKLKHLSAFFPSFQDPAGIFELVEVVGNGTYGQVYKVGWRRSTWPVLFSQWRLATMLPPLLIKPGNKESGIKHAWVLDAIAPHYGQLIW